MFKQSIFKGLSCSGFDYLFMLIYMLMVCVKMFQFLMLLCFMNIEYIYEFNLLNIYVKLGIIVYVWL